MCLAAHSIQVQRTSAEALEDAMRRQEPSQTGGKARQREIAIGALLCLSNIRDAAEAAGISERTLQRWLSDPRFQAQYKAGKKSLVDKATDRLQAGTLRAVATLERIMDDGNAPAAARVNACRFVIEFGLRTHAEKSASREGKPTNAEFEARISLLEKAFSMRMILVRSDGTTRRLNNTEADVCQAMPQLTAEAE